MTAAGVAEIRPFEKENGSASSSSSAPPPLPNKDMSPALEMRWEAWREKDMAPTSAEPSSYFGLGTKFINCHNFVLLGVWRVAFRHHHANPAAAAAGHACAGRQGHL